jgi:predicted SAM-dependent methyltransferase
MEIELGAGKNPKHPTAESVDHLPNAQHQIDLEEGHLPFDNNSVEKIYAEDVLEHIRNLIPLMDECHRVMKPSGTMHITVPHYKSEGAFQDPTHVRYFTPKTFKYFTHEYIDIGNFDSGIEPWELVSIEESDKINVILKK